jgi:hypothetical protein
MASQSATSKAMSVVSPRKGAFQQGNTWGKHKRPLARHVSELCRDYTTGAVKRLAAIMMQDRDLRSAVAAAKELLDRGYGKSPITFDVLHTLNDRELEDTARKILEKRKVIDAGELVSNKESRQQLAAGDTCQCNRRHHGNAKRCKACAKPIVR